MAYTKEEIFAKVGELLGELNSHYADLNPVNISENKSTLVLLEANARYLSAHIEVLNDLSLFSATDPAADIVEESYVKPVVAQSFADTKAFFTPPSPQFAKREVDHQQTHEEIKELPTAQEPAASVPLSPVFVPETNTPWLPEEVVAEEEQPSFVSAASTAFVPMEEVAAVASPLPMLADAEKIPFQAATVIPEPVVEPIITAPVVQPVAVVNEWIEEAREINIEEKVSAPEVNPGRPLTRNEMLQQQRQASTGQTTFFPTTKASATERNSDLKSSISLNDKLVFIKDLFNGYSLAYSEAIELLNRYPSFAEADAFLQINYALKNNWADKPQTVEKLYAILRKKYM